MRVMIGASILTACLAGAIAVQAQQQQAPPAGGGQRPGGAAPQAPKNLQVLPKDWTIPQVSAFMRTFAGPGGLGVQCTYCHETDRSLDTKKEKLVARKMIAMVMAINDTYLKDVGEPIAAVAPAAPGAPPAPPPMKVTCYTCHRGTTKPLTAPAPGGGGH